MQGDNRTNHESTKGWEIKFFNSQGNLQENICLVLFPVAISNVMVDYFQATGQYDLNLEGKMFLNYLFNFFQYLWSGDGFIRGAALTVFIECIWITNSSFYVYWYCLSFIHDKYHVIGEKILIVDDYFDEARLY